MGLASKSQYLPSARCRFRPCDPDDPGRLRRAMVHALLWQWYAGNCLWNVLLVIGYTFLIRQALQSGISGALHHDSRAGLNRVPMGADGRSPAFPCLKPGCAFSAESHSDSGWFLLAFTRERRGGLCLMSLVYRRNDPSRCRHAGIASNSQASGNALQGEPRDFLQALLWCKSWGTF